MNGTPGASSFERRSASIPSKRGIEKSERIACGFDEARTRFRSSSSSTRSHETSNPPCSSERSASSTSTSESSTKSSWIRFLSMGLFAHRFLGFLRGGLEREEEDGSLADFRFGPDAPAVPVHDALHGRKPDAGSRVFGRGMQALKRAEELVGVGHVEARSVVADEEGRAAAILQGADFDVRLRRLRGELPRVSNEVVEGGPQQMRIAFGAHSVPDRDFRR